MLADQDLGCSQWVDAPDTVHFVLASDPVSIREGLRGFVALDLMAPLTEESLGTVQIVLAEVLNNVVEHAYARFPGMIEVWVTRRDTYLFLRTIDEGLTMPGGVLPDGKLTASDDLPEGGFGWFLIRNLSHDLTYQRDGARNRLSLCISVDYQA